MMMNLDVLMISSVILQDIPGEDAVYNFIKSMIEENQYCSEVFQKIF